MKLNITARTVGKKSDAKKIRREGNIPAIVYVNGKKGEEIVVEGGAFRKALNHIEKGTLATQIFTLQKEGKQRRAILKDIQYKPTNYEIIHLDFAEIDDKKPVKVNVSIRCTGMDRSIGVQQGGVLRQVIRNMRVNCLPKDIPSYFELDVSSLGLGQTKKLRDIALPKGVSSEAGLNEVAAVIAKR
ncbi:MAG: 50S ribosomal protein L25 [Chlamydiae bacterium]|nr:50S ribosomal protein L25 [Chlamydiota bacterium]